MLVPTPAPVADRSRRRKPPAPPTELHTLTELLDAMSDAAASGIPARLAVDAVLDRLRPAPPTEEIRELCRAGLIALANGAEARLRHAIATSADDELDAVPVDEAAADEPPPVRRFSIRGPTPTERRDALTMRLEAADGTVKPLLLFADVDLARLESAATGQIDGWSRRRKAAHLGRRLLATSGAATIGELDAAGQARMRAAVEGAWR